MHEPHPDARWVLAWLTARSVARHLPAPQLDRGGFRVEVNAEQEQRRWVFPSVCDGLRALGTEITAPRELLKLCAPPQVLREALPPRWQIQPAAYFMHATSSPRASVPVPERYRVELADDGARKRVHVFADDGALAASGHAAEAAGVFIYDRIETAPTHRRKGLGRLVMNTLGASRSASTVPQLLVATESGRHLYETLGWSVLSLLSTAEIPTGS